jgi:hypothetical protein
MKKCCETGETRRSIGSRIYNSLILIILVVVVLGILYGVIF